MKSSLEFSNEDINLYNKLISAICSDTSNESEVRELIQNNKNIVNMQDSESKTPLIYACIHGKLSVVECLIENGAVLDIQDSRAKTALMYACDKNYSYIINALIKSNANVDIVDYNNKTAFIHSYERNKLEILPRKYISLSLLEKSNQKDKILDYALVEAIENKDNCIIDYMTKEYFWFVLEYALFKKNKFLLDYILERVIRFELNDKIDVFLFANKRKISSDVFTYLFDKDRDLLDICVIYIYICQENYTYNGIVTNHIEDMVKFAIPEYAKKLLNTERGTNIKKILEYSLNTEFSHLRRYSHYTDLNFREENMMQTPLNYEDKLNTGKNSNRLVYEFLNRIHNDLFTNKTIIIDNIEKYNNCEKIEEKNSCFKNISKLILNFTLIDKRLNSFLNGNLRLLNKCSDEYLMIQLRKQCEFTKQLISFAESSYNSADNFLDVIMNNFLNNFDLNIILSKIDYDLTKNLDNVNANIEKYYSENSIQEKDVSSKKVDDLLLNFLSIYKGLNIIKKRVNSERTEELIQLAEDLYKEKHEFWIKNKNSYLTKEDIFKSSRTNNRKRKENSILLERKEHRDNIKKAYIDRSQGI